jgi:hypothetical protein
MGCVMRSGTAAKLSIDKIRMQRIRVARLDEGSDAVRERDMVTPCRFEL